MARRIYVAKKEESGLGEACPVIIRRRVDVCISRIFAVSLGQGFENRWWTACASRRDLACLHSQYASLLRVVHEIAWVFHTSHDRE